MWPKEIGADKYEIQVSTYSNFQSNLLDKIPQTPIYASTADLPTSKYLYWRYRPITGTTNGTWSSTWSFVIPPPALSAPALISPANAWLTKEHDLTFNWKTVLDGAKYELLISKSSSFATVERDIVGLTPADPKSLSMNYVANALPDGKYYWKVRAFNSSNVPGKWSTSRTLTIDAQAPPVPVLKLPVADAIMTGTPTYSWNASTGASRYMFGYDAVGCLDPTYKSLELTGTSVKPPTQPVGLWYWCVRARDAAGNWSNWSAGRSVTVNPATPVAPILISPVTGIVTGEVTPDFSWGSVAFGNTYRIQISTSSTFATTEQDVTGGVGVLNYTPDSDLSEGKHYWRVRAINGMSVAGPWSAARYFTVDTTTPAVPGLSLPLNNSVVTSVPTYSWAAPTGANRYMLSYDTHADCASPDYTSVELTLNSHKPVSQPYGTFYWCVKARDAAGNWSAWSVPNKLIITPF